MIGDGDLRTVHVDGVGPVCFAQSIQDAPQRSDPLGADGELDLRDHSGPGQLPGEVTGVGAQPDPPGPRRSRQPGQRLTQQLHGMAAGLLVAGHPLRGSTVAVSAQVTTCGARSAGPGG